MKNKHAYKMYVPQQNQGESIDAYYRRLVTQANRRLTALENLQKQEGYKGVTSFAYARAQRDIQAMQGEKGRWSTEVPGNAKTTLAKIKDIQEFLGSPTSTKTGINQVFKEKAKTTNKLYGTNFSWQDLANFYDSENAKKISEKYKASKTLIRALGAIKRVGDDPDAIQSVIEGTKKASNDDIVNEVAKRLLNEGYSASDLFK